MSKTKLNKIIGLKYEYGSGLPTVLLKSAGNNVETVLEYNRVTAQAPVIKDEKLVNELYRLPVDAEIGEDLFHLVAGVLVHVFSVEGKLSEGSR